MKWAATFLALASAAAFLRWYSPAAPVLVQGSALPRGEVASTAPGGSIANDKTFFAANAARIKMSDGSTVDLKDNSGFAYAKSGLGSEVITLSSGSASFVIKPRKPAQSFKVKTPIAEMTVIGTRFTVTEVMDSISVYESSPESAGRTYAEQVARVIVKVEEGTVGVSNGKLAIRVPAGQTAVVRRDQPLIQVLSNDGHM